MLIQVEQTSLKNKKRVVRKDIILQVTLLINENAVLSGKQESWVPRQVTGIFFKSSETRTRPGTC